MDIQENEPIPGSQTVLFLSLYLFIYMYVMCVSIYNFCVHIYVCIYIHMCVYMLMYICMKLESINRKLVKKRCKPRIRVE